MGLGRGRISLEDGRDSDIRGQVPEDDTDTFVFTVPLREVPEPQLDPSSEAQDIAIINDDENNWVQMEESVDDMEPAAAEGRIFSNASSLDLLQYLFNSWPKPAVIDQSEIQEDTDVDMENPIEDNPLHDIDTSVTVAPMLARKKKKVKVSKHGIQYPSFPAGVVKKLATTYARTGGSGKAKIGKDTLDAIMQATDWFFEQVSDDLDAYAKHAGRKTIEDSDVITLMTRYVVVMTLESTQAMSWNYIYNPGKLHIRASPDLSTMLIYTPRQRQTNLTTTPFSLAQKLLPRELLQELRMVPPAKLKRGRQLERVNEEEEWIYINVFFGEISRLMY
jgi:histone H3/H4